MPSITSLVPPSIELALVRSQARGRAPPLRALAFPFQRVDAAGRHQDLVAALVQLGAVIFHRRRKRRMRLPCLRQIDCAFGGSRERRLVDLEGRRSAPRSIGSSSRPCSSLPIEIRGDLAERHALTPRSPMPQIIVALVLQQIFRDIPAPVDGADHVRLRHPHIVEEGFAERRVAGDQQDRLGRDALRRHVEQDEADAVMLLGAPKSVRTRQKIQSA